MPGNTDWCEYPHELVAHRKRAEAAVRTKFPNLIEGSSGWHRALANRLQRTRL